MYLVYSRRKKREIRDKRDIEIKTAIYDKDFETETNAIQYDNLKWV